MYNTTVQEDRLIDDVDAAEVFGGRLSDLVAVIERLDNVINQRDMEIYKLEKEIERLTAIVKKLR